MPNDVPSDGITALSPIERKTRPDVPESHAEVNISRGTGVYKWLLAGALAIGAGGFYGGTKVADHRATAEAVEAYDKALRALEKGDAEIAERIVDKRGILNNDEKAVLLVGIEASLRRHEPVIARSKELSLKARELTLRIADAKKMLRR